MTKKTENSNNAETPSLNIAGVSGSFLLSRGFRQLGESDLYAVSLPSDGVELISDIHGNLWMEYWFEKRTTQSVGFGKYNLDELTKLLNVLLR